MIYTIGHTESYEKYFEEYENPQKGISGSVWKTWQAAKWFTYKKEILHSVIGDLACQTLVNNGYSVYGVWADWDRDTVNTGKTWNDLIVPADLVKIRKDWGGTLE